MVTSLSAHDIKRICAVSLLIGTLFTLTGCFEDDDTPAENAAEELSEGVEDAVEELDPNRTTGEKIGDAIEDTGEEIKDASE